MAQKERNEIPADVAARVQFRSNRICCVCNEPRKAIQIHHIDEDPSNNDEQNLAVLCIECHDQTQIRGGFGRKLDRHQVTLYRDNWYASVECSRQQTEGTQRQKTFPGAPHAIVQGRTVQLSYLTVSENDDEHRYAFRAEYPQLSPEESTDVAEINLTLAAFVVDELQRFRTGAIGASKYKQEKIANRSEEMAWDKLSISHAIGEFTADMLSVEFQFAEYGAGAAHSRHATRTFNYLLKPPRQLTFWDIFRHSSRQTCIETISRYCIFSLNEQKPEFLKANSDKPTDWILRGAAANEEHFKKLLLERGGVRFFFDPYSMACYAEGRYDVFVPARVLSSMMHGSISRLLDVR
jgi:hypothetical protein